MRGMPPGKKCQRGAGKATALYRPEPQCGDGVTGAINALQPRRVPRLPPAIISSSVLPHCSAGHDEAPDPRGAAKGDRRGGSHRPDPQSPSPDERDKDPQLPASSDISSAVPLLPQHRLGRSAGSARRRGSRWRRAPGGGGSPSRSIAIA
jgi:hypothetical protein